MLRHSEWTNFLVGILAWVGIVQFLGCVYVAIRFYPAPYGQSEYRVADHFLSDLGRGQTDSGRSNTDAAAVFNRSVVALGLALIPFLMLLPAEWEHGRAAMRVAG